MGAFRRFGIFALCTAALIGGGIWAGRLFPGRDKAPAAPPAQFQKPDTSGSEAWRKRYPWLYRDSTLIPYRDAVLRPLMGGDSPRGLRKHAGYLEAVMPRGRPVHDAAWTLESAPEN